MFSGAGAASGWGALAQIAQDVMGHWQQGYFQNKAHKFSTQQQIRQHSFLERMSNTAVQRRAADLEAAGYNKILALKNDATTPPGSMTGGTSAQSTVDKGLQYGTLGLIKAQTEQASSAAAFNRAKKETIEPAANLGDFFGGLLERVFGNLKSAAKNVNKDGGHPRDIIGQLQNKLGGLLDGIFGSSAKHSARTDAQILNERERQFKQNRGENPRGFSDEQLRSTLSMLRTALDRASEKHDTKMLDMLNARYSVVYKEFKRRGLK